jgi:hypothetical protein
VLDAWVGEHQRQPRQVAGERDRESDYAQPHITIELNMENQSVN